ncbi:uncharacterized protein EHS24_004805 [Apiotrichum porosum]|uniref:Uncharacterized protein n=1 Tax=Apiotrichum porosum TaxID=105984 RepID=A0A427Y626_9TREE|nr:uncharacterized protein EHS24_004805 [Apiotrichum porosum]RSH86538.1 hypothetical protein EHS24_004805 [Apiotrichum porosum]
MITIPLEIAKQLPISKYRLLDSLYREFEGLPLPLSHEVLAEALELADLVVSSPVFEVDVKTEAIAWKATLMEHADDWHKMKNDTGADSPLYRVLLGMQEEIQSLRHALSGAQRRLDTYDEARFNHARRVLGLPPSRSTPGTPPHFHNHQPMYANPSVITRMSADRLRDALEVYLDETPPLEANREQMVKALKVCCGMEETGL